SMPCCRSLGNRMSSPTRPCSDLPAGGPEDADDVPGEDREDHDDHVDAVSRAWRAAVRRNPTLYAVVDANVERYPALRRAHRAELMLLAVISGLAEPPARQADHARVGGTHAAL